MTTPNSPTGTLAGRLSTLASDIIAATKADGQAAPVTLAHACRGFVIAGAVSGLLDQYAIPRRDAFTICDEACDRTVAMLTELLGEHLLRRYSHGARRADLDTMLRHGQNELLDATPEDIDDIAAAMITLAAALRDALAPLPDNESLPPTTRGAARMAADTAAILHSHYGGDSGGW
ncbi:hypothetical protein ETD86_46545 [Nonomuraea turkmeniaca]|uniref:Uncharacterized protein n=1 Tax=Nonomuraea turkmeniaca TaxID=103838 RepID=A0A5S4EYD5_9ACTN|nr:hypothetical protein [Nonomuraea turkmeniaca]TMR08713.1 hypothetical protein ETD86_46545 [Nonomuraea turkmeniaca]